MIMKSDCFIILAIILDEISQSAQNNSLGISQFAGYIISSKLLYLDKSILLDAKHMITTLCLFTSFTSH